MDVRRPIRVAFCIDNMNVGGTELNAVRTAERLDRSRFHLSVICLQEDGPLVPRYAAAGVRVHPFPIGNLYGPAALRQGVALSRWLREQRIDILHAHDIYSNVFGVVWGRAAGVRCIASRRWWEGFPQPHWKAAGRLSYTLADAVLANSEAVGRFVRERERVPAARLAVVPNFVDEHCFVAPDGEAVNRLRAELGIDGESQVVGIVANLLPVKDHVSLLRAIASLALRWPAVRLVLVGDGGERVALQQLASSLQIADRVVFAGRRGNDPNLHHLFDVSVLCSISEGLSNSILEAMAAGRPVVATDVGASSDAVVHGQTGILVPAGDPGALAAALDQLLAAPELGRSMGEAGRRRALERYSVDAALGALEALYFRVVGRDSESLSAAGHSAHPSALI